MIKSEQDRLAHNPREIKPGSSYYGFTRTLDGDGRILTETLTNFAGFRDDVYNPNREFRVASLLIPDRMIYIWRTLKQDYIVVNSDLHLKYYLRIGGNALVEESIAIIHLPDWIEPREHVRLGYGGWLPVTELSEAAFKHAPSAKLRMCVLKRDGFRCRLCGRSPDNHVDVELHVHHVRPFGRASQGVTHEKNLLTLCHTCHKGLDPHEDNSLFEFTGAGMMDMIMSVQDCHDEGVSRYRAAFRAMIEKREIATNPPA